MVKERKAIAKNAELLDLISELDVNAVGIVSLAEWKGTELEETALSVLPRARSVVVFAMELFREVIDLTKPERTMGATSLNDLYTSHANYINGQLTEAAYDAAKAFRSVGLKALPFPSADSPWDARFLEAVLSYKHAGQAAGLGKIGWNGLLIAPDLGPRVRLSACVTEAELQPTGAVNMTFECDECRLCIEHCPAKAIAEPPTGEQYAVNKFACSTFLTASGLCNECMRVCPAYK